MRVLNAESTEWEKVTIKFISLHYQLHVPICLTYFHLFADKRNFLHALWHKERDKKWAQCNFSFVFLLFLAFPYSSPFCFWLECNSHYRDYVYICKSLGDHTSGGCQWCCTNFYAICNEYEHQLHMSKRFNNVQFVCVRVCVCVRFNFDIFRWWPSNVVMQSNL